MNFQYIFIDEMVLSNTVYQYSTHSFFSLSNSPLIIFAFDFYNVQINTFLSSLNVLKCVLGVCIVVISITELKNTRSVWYCLQSDLIVPVMINDQQGVIIFIRTENYSYL